MKDNSTGKDKEFYELGKKMFDRLNPPGTPPFKPYVSKREWVGLTDEEIEDAIDDGFAFGLDDGNVSNQTVIRYVRVIEAKLKEKNT
jgi:hypothetical protein